MGRLLGLELPVFCERHAKVAFNDALGAVPRDAPLMIWTDPVRLPWSDEERAELAASEHRRLLEEFPAGVHGRPEGAGDEPDRAADLDVRRRAGGAHLPGDVRSRVRRDHAPRDVPHDPRPGWLLRALPRAFVDGGYYTKTRENRFPGRPASVEGAYVIGGLSGYGIMSSNAAADLLADHITGAPCRLRPRVLPRRYDDPAYQALPSRPGATPASCKIQSFPAERSAAVAGGRGRAGPPARHSRWLAVGAALAPDGTRRVADESAVHDPAPLYLSNTAQAVS